MDKNLCVAYACDNNHVEQTGISMISLFENNRNFTDIIIYFIDMGVNTDNKILLNEIVKSYGRRIIFIKFKDIAWDLNAVEGARHILSVYAKMFLFRVDSEINKILYLDSDTVITSSLMNLWNENLDGKCIAATKTTCKKCFKRELGIDEKEAIVNDGIVLIDLALWRQRNYLEKCLKKIKEFDGNPPILSEGVINSVLKQDIYYMHPKYNVSAILTMFSREELIVLTGCSYYAEEQIKEATSTPAIIHYAGNTHIRPWFKNSDYPLNEYYYKYKSMSPWKDISLKRRGISKKMIIVKVIHKVLPSKLFLYLYKLKNK